MDFFKFFSNKAKPKETAKERLKLILIHDRADLSPELLELIKSELLKVIAKYADIDSSDVDIRLTRTDEKEGNSPALIANIPIKSVKNR